MTTAEALESITDPGKFELLLDSILSRSSTDYAPIIEYGLNAKGKTVRSPVDAFCQVPFSRPPKFVLIEHTTIEKKDLKKKWLFDHSCSCNLNSNEYEDGDLIKAGNQVRELRDEFPDAAFIVVLTTNKRFSYELEKELRKKAKELSIDFLDIWDQSRITRYLDEPEGHWLRKNYLGIEAEQLSEPLFRELCQKNLSLYYKELFTNLGDLIPRKKYEEIKSGIKIKNPSVEFLVGDSGFGKSTIAYNLLKNHIKNGGLGLWVRPEYTIKSSSIESMVCKVLRDLYPSLSNDAENALLNIAENNSKIFIVVDDINRDENSDKIIHKFLLGQTETYREIQSLSLRIFLTSLFVPFGQVCGIHYYKNLKKPNGLNLTLLKCLMRKRV